jgi:NAD(P)-dependent dehydrogenase (short-subunit alcohol dehydrogenase family)
MPLHLETTSRENYQKAVVEHVKAFGEISITINNSAMHDACRDLKDIDLDVVEIVFLVHILGMYAISKNALKYLKSGPNIVSF